MDFENIFARISDSKREILTDFRILQLQRIADSTIFWAWFLDFVCNKSIFVQVSDSGEILTADVVNKS